MTLPLPTTTGTRRSAVRFRLLGFPVGVDLSFVIVLGFLGYTTLSRGPAFLAVWIAVAAVAVLVHELGHAVAARAAGAHPLIELYGFGGVTTFEHPARGLSRARSVVISVAGPATGLVLGAGLLALRRVVGLDPTSLAAYAVQAGIFVTLGWGLLNLLPILPLDGGNVLLALMPGSRVRRQRLAAIVSAAVAAAAAVIALLTGWLFAALLAGWFAVGNVAALRPAPATVAPTAEQLARRARDSRAALWLVEQGRPEEARHLAETAPEGIDPAVAGVVLAALARVRGSGPLGED